MCEYHNNRNVSHAWEANRLFLENERVVINLL
jgi:hypothetical protein